jgi:nitrate/nitrite transporter NarK
MRLFRATLAALFGAFVALALYLAWFFQITHHNTPWDGAPAGFIALTAIVAIFCGLIGGYLAAVLAPETPRGSAEGAAGFIALAALFAETHTPGQHHYAQMVALLALAPAAYLIGRTRPPVIVERVR